MTEVVRLQAQLQQLRTQFEETAKELEKTQKERDKLRENNKRGDIEYRKLAEVVKGNGAMQQVQQLMEDRERLQSQCDIFKEMLRTNAEEIEKYKTALAEGNAAANDTAKKQAELQARLTSLRTEIKDVEGQIAGLEGQLAVEKARVDAASANPNPIAAAADGVPGDAAAPSNADPPAEGSPPSAAAGEPQPQPGADGSGAGAAAAGSGGAATDPPASGAAAAPPAPAAPAIDVAAVEAQLGPLRTRLAELRSSLAAAEDEAEDSASAAVKATRLRERLEREAKERVAALETQLASKIHEVASLQEAASNAEAAHLQQLENMIAKVTEREVEVATLRAEAKAAMDTVESFKSQLEDSKRKLDEETKKAATSSKNKVDDAVVADLNKKLEAAQEAVRQLTDSTAEMSRAKDSALEEARVTREKLIKREQKLTTAVQEKAEAQSQVADLTADIAATRKKLETAKKKLKLDEESLKAARTELERVKEECRSLTEYKMRADAELAELKTKLSDLDATHAAKLTELEAAQSTIAAQTEAISQLESAVAAAEARIEEQAANHAIAVRLTKQMNRELKVQLAAEAKRVARLERDLASAHKSAQQQGGYNHLPNQHQHQHSQSSRALGGTPGPNQGGASGASPGPGGGFGVGGGMGGAGTTPARPGVASAGTATPASAAGARGGAAASLRSPLPMGTPPLGRSMSQQVPHTHSSQSQHHANRQQRTPASASGGKNLAPMGGGNMEETVRLLGTRLQAVLAESETAREKVKMLESIIQGLTEELAEKRRLLKQLTGSKADGDMETEAKKVVASAASGENPVNMLSRLLENALKDNARLKREQKTIAQDLTAKQEAFQRLQEETQQLQSALAAARAAPANGDESGSLRDDAGSQYTGRDSVPLPADDVASMSDYPPSERDSVVPVPTEQATAAAAPDDAAHNNPFG